MIMVVIVVLVKTVMISVSDCGKVGDVDGGCGDDGNGGDCGCGEEGDDGVGSCGDDGDGGSRLRAVAASPAKSDFMLLLDDFFIE